MTPPQQETLDYRPASPPEAGRDRRRRLFMRMVIFAIVLMFVAMVAVLYYRWVTVPEPNSMVAIVGGKELAGATVTVEAFFLAKPYEVGLDANGSGRFFPQPGQYSLRVHYGDHPNIMQYTVDIEPDSLNRIDLRPTVASTRPWLRETN